MQALGRADPNITIMIRADQDIRYGKLVEVMKILHDARIARMALVTQPEGGARQP
jgi:biopolymer transport protein ExbD